MRSLFLSLFLIIGCSGDSPTAGEGTLFSGYQIKLVNAGDCTVTDAEIDGSCNLVFVNPAPEEDNNYTMTVDLVAGGSASLVAHADSNGNGGLELRFTRNSDNEFDVDLFVAGSSPVELDTEFSGIPADRAVTISLDVHSSHGHYIVWVNDDEIYEDVYAGALTNRLWGLVLENGTVTSAKIDEAREHH